MRIFAFILFLAVMGSSYAAPQGGAVADTMADFLSEHGLVARVDGVPQESEESIADNLVGQAMAFLGVPYKRGGNTADTGFDCSGFVRAVYAQALGKLLPRRAEQQAAATQSIDSAELQPGDLVFFNTLRRAFSHVGIYIGDGKFIHSPRPGAQVRIDAIGRTYWLHRFDGARRVPLDLPGADRR